MKNAHRLGAKRKLIQLYAAVLYNCYARGFIKGDIFKGDTKMLCVPGLNCYSCPGAIGACPLGALQNALAASDKRAPAYMVGILLLYGLLLGRTICGWLCPMGLVQEVCHKLPTPKIGKGRATAALSYFKYFLLFALVIIVPYRYSYQLLPLPAFCKYICPAGTLEGAIGLMVNPANAGNFSMLNVLFTNKFIILIVFLLLCVFVYRAFCRFFCPLGALYGLFARVAVFGVKVEKSACTDCGRCVQHCKMDIRRVGDHECIHCGECIDVCPTGAISFKAGKITLRANEAATQNGMIARDKKRRCKQWLLAAALMIVLGAVIAFVHLNDPAPAKTAAWTAKAAKPSQTGDAQTEKALPMQPENAQTENTPYTYTIDESLPVGMEIGMRAPDFSAQLCGDEGTFVLSDMLGRPVIINFWATWCTPCCLELTHFDRVYNERGGEVAVVALHTFPIVDDVEGYLRKHDYRMPFGLDPDGSVADLFGGGSMLPRTVIIDRNGVIVFTAIGSMDYEMLTELLAKCE